MTAPFQAERPRLWRWRLLGGAGPPLAYCVTVAHAARRAAYAAHERREGTRRAPSELHGPPQGGARDGRHLHAFWLPEDSDGDRRIDRVAVYAAAGFSPAALRALAGARRIAVYGSGAWGLEPAPAAPDGGESARRWASATPFFPPLYAARERGGAPRPRHAPEAQLARIISAWRTPDGAPLPAVSISMRGRECPDTGLAARDFRIGRRHEARARDGAAWFALEFAQPVAGPLAFGLEAHFGLGRFRPLE